MTRTVGWDVVVAGADAAGFCVARALARAGRRTLLLEAGTRSADVC